MTSFRAVITDLDGTIVRDDNTISDATRRAAAELAAEGIPLIVATARTPAGLDVLESIAAHVPIAVCCNGSIGYVPATREFRWRRTLSPTTVKAIVEVLREHLPGAGAAVYDGQRWTLSPAYVAARDKLPRGPRRIAPAHDLPADGVCAMAIAESSLASPDIASVLTSAGIGVELAVISYAAADVLDIAPPGTDKAAGVAAALDLLNVDPQETIAFGDAPNDLPMFGLCGQAVAVANAYPGVLAAADSVTASVESDGFSTALASMGLIQPARRGRPGRG